MLIQQSFLQWVHYIKKTKKKQLSMVYTIVDLWNDVQMFKPIQLFKLGTISFDVFSEGRHNAGEYITRFNWSLPVL